MVNACTLINPKISKRQYDQLETGMTLSQVQHIMGKPGENSAEIYSNTSVYQWKNPDGSSVTAVFVNDKLAVKTQVNLK